MATHSGAITSADAQYRQGFANKLYMEGVVKNPVMKVLMENDCINREDDLEKNKGGTVTMYNRLRIDGQGQIGDVDFYSLAEQLETNSRTMNILKISKPITWYREGSQSAQYAPFKLDDGTQEALIDYIGGICSASVINQVTGNNASSINQPSLDSSTAFTGANLLQVTGSNAVTAPSYWYEANLGGAITTAAGITSGNTLSLADFELACTVITSQTAGRATWQTIKNKAYIGIAFISYTGLYQLTREATTLGQGAQLTAQIQAQMSGGKTEFDLQEFFVAGIPLKFCVVPDSWMPRGVTASGTAETANTRRAVVVGRNALDMSFGKGYSGTTASVRGLNVEIDTEHKKLNKQAYGNASVLWGCEKTLSTGTGATAGTSYDLATYVIDHYSAT